MKKNPSTATSRRSFLKSAGRATAASVLLGGIGSGVHAAENNTIKLALVGCGGRGTGAVVDALGVKHGPMKLVAMADVFPKRQDVPELRRARIHGGGCNPVLNHAEFSGTRPGAAADPGDGSS